MSAMRLAMKRVDGPEAVTEVGDFCWLDERERGRFRTHTGDVIRTADGKAWPRFTFRSH